jgi:membrane protease YdiL (CAAX protease family)
MYPLLMAASLVLSTVSTGSPPPLAHLRELIAEPTRLLLLLPVLLVGGPLAEELGWSGYALDRLQERRSALSASLILGAVGVLWHLPLFFMRGTAQGEMGFGTPLFLAWVVLHVSVKLHRTWVYNNAARSTLAAILLHFMTNLSFTAVSGLHQSIPPDTAIIQATLYLLVALFVLRLWGPQTMTRRRMGSR